MQTESKTSLLNSAPNVFLQLLTRFYGGLKVDLPFSTPSELSTSWKLEDFGGLNCGTYQSMITRQQMTNPLMHLLGGKFRTGPSMQNVINS